MSAVGFLIGVVAKLIEMVLKTLLPVSWAPAATNVARLFAIGAAIAFIGIEIWARL